MRCAILKVIACLLTVFISIAAKGQSNSIENEKMLTEIIISSIDDDNNLFLYGSCDVKTYLFIWNSKGGLIKKIEIPRFKDKYKIDTRLLPKEKVILEWWYENKRKVRTVTLI